MDFELLLRACWRRRLLVVVVTILAAAVAVVFTRAFVSPKYAATSDVAVFPPPDANQSVASVYAVQPDRYVLTQIAILSSRAALERVAGELSLSFQAVEHIVSAKQVGNSDVIAVTASSTSGHLAVEISSRIVQDYVNTLATDAQAAAVSIQSQITGVDQEITQLQAQLAFIGQSTAQAGPLQQQINTLASQVVSLSNTRSALLTETGNPTTTRIVSTANNATPTNTSTKKVALYAALAGFTLTLSGVALTAGPSHTLEDLDSLDEIAGAPVLGVVTQPRHLRTRRRKRIAEARNFRVATGLRAVVRVNGPVTLVPVGRASRVAWTAATLQGFFSEGPVVTQTLTGRALDWIRRQGSEDVPTEPAGVGLVRAPGSGISDANSVTLDKNPPRVELEVVPLSVVIAHDAREVTAIVLVVDVPKIRSNELHEIVNALRAAGLDVVGIVGGQ